MWQLLLIAAAGTGFFARCLRKRPTEPREEESTGNGALNSVGLEFFSQISNGEDTHIVEDKKSDLHVFPVSEQAAGEASATIISTRGGSLEIPTSWKGKAEAFHGYRGRGFCMDAQCSKIRDSRHSEDHESTCSGSWNVGHTQKRRLRKKIVGDLQKRRKSSRNVEGKKVNADIVGQYEKSNGALWFSYGVGIGVMFMIASGKCEIDKLTLLLHQTIGLVQELKRQLDERKDYLQDSEMHNGCHGENYTYQQEHPDAAANWKLEKDYPNSVGTPFQANESAVSVITDEPAQQVTGMVEIEAELQAELEYIQMNFLQSNSKLQRKTSGSSEYSNSSVEMVEGELCADGLPGHWSSADKTPSENLDISHVDDYGVSPYELDKRIRDLLEKQQEEKISELEVELKSTEIKLHAKERELQHWKERVRCLAELSFGANSGDNSASFETTNNADGKRHYTRKASGKSSARSINNSGQEGNSVFPLWSFSHCTEGPLESTADSLDQLNYRGKMADLGTGSTDLDYFEDIVQTGWVPNFRDSTDGTCMDFVKRVSDVGSDACCEINSTSKHRVGQGIGDMHENGSEASTACSVFGHE